MHVIYGLILEKELQKRYTNEYLIRCHIDVVRSVYGVIPHEFRGFLTYFTPKWERFRDYL